MSKIWASVLCILLSGCLSSNTVQLSPDTYMTRVEDHGGIFAFKRGQMKPEAMKKANEFAASQGKVAVPVAMDSHPVGVLGDWAAVEYQFKVVSKDDPEAVRTALVPRPDFVFESNNKNTSNITTKDESKKDTYTELIKLDDLKKKGIISEAEFDEQKKKLLNS